MNATLPGPAANTEAIRLALQSWPDVEAYLKGCKGIIIPLGFHRTTWTHRCDWD